MGRILVPFGIQGWIKLKTFTEDPDGLARHPQWWLRTKSGWRSAVQQDFRVRPAAVSAKLEGVDDRNAAELLRGLDAVQHDAEKAVSQDRGRPQDLVHRLLPLEPVDEENPAAMGGDDVQGDRPRNNPSLRFAAPPTRRTSKLSIIAAVGRRPSPYRLKTGIPCTGSVKSSDSIMLSCLSPRNPCWGPKAATNLISASAAAGTRNGLASSTAKSANLPTSMEPLCCSSKC